MTHNERLLNYILKDCERRNCSPTKWGQLAINDGKLVGRLKAGKTITIATMQRIEWFCSLGAGGMTQTTQHDRLQFARCRSGFSSAASAARAVGIPESTYRAHENGQNGFSIDEAKGYAKHFNVTPEYLVFGNPIKPPLTDVDCYHPPCIVASYFGLSSSGVTAQKVRKIFKEYGVLQLLTVSHVATDDISRFRMSAALNAANALLASLEAAE
ncbi:MAG: helix-turn-helix transcriptional regulator [Hyphomicrobiales bacterium]